MKYVLISLLTLVIISGCAKKIDKPVWLKINKWDLVDNPILSNEGILTQNISEVWLNIDGKIAGTYQLPVKIPLAEQPGEHTLIMIPGIKNNGISATKARYNLVKQYITNVTLTREDTVVISPQTSYKDGVKFWIEDFESINNLKIVDDPVSTASLTTSSDPDILAYGNYCGHINMTQEHNNWYAYSNSNLDLPTGGADVYLEVDFYNTQYVQTALLSVSNGNISDDPAIQLNPQTNPVWKKIYIDLKELVSHNSNANYYEIALSSILEEGVTEKDIYIDNIKVVSF